jgi:hypothetical protein
MAEVLRPLELTRPKAAFLFPRAIFRRHIFETVAAVGDGIAVRNKPAAKVFTARCADRHHTPVTVCVATLAAHDHEADLVGERKGGFLAAAIGYLIAAAPLAGFGRIDAMQPYALPMDFEAVTIDDRGAACNAFLRYGGQRQGSGEDKQGGADKRA